MIICNFPPTLSVLKNKELKELELELKGQILEKKKLLEEKKRQLEEKMKEDQINKLMVCSGAGIMCLLFYSI
jgi:septum formation inhibitor-activating ATPase MinD